jgi:uncharacterized protein (DUF1697 family)
MNTWIALLRGINVGGNNILPMQDLRNLLTDLGYDNVRTYIQSGNCVFQSSIKDADEIAALIGAAIDKQFGFKPQVFVLSLERLTAVIEANPYPEAIDTPQYLGVFFLARPAENPDLATLEELCAPSEAFTLTDTAFYLHAPDGMGRSKLAAKIEKIVKVSTTARNLRSCLKIAAMAEMK